MGMDIGACTGILVPLEEILEKLITEDNASEVVKALNVNFKSLVEVAGVEIVSQVFRFQSEVA